MSNVKSQMSNVFGFTLIELMVVIAIIAVLSTIGLMSYRMLLQNSRDGKRQADLGVLQSSLEQYYSDQHAYPVIGTTGTSCTNGALTMNCPLKDPGGQKTYQNLVASDPLPSPYPQYVYKAFDALSGRSLECSTTATKCLTYCLYAAFEGNTSSITSQVCRERNPDSTKYNFAVSPP